MNDLNFSANSMMDEFGRVFFKNGRVYRAISYESTDACRILLKEPFFIELTNKGLIPKTKIADFSLSGFGLVLEHEKLLNTLQHEWTFSMMKNAAMVILEIIDICVKHGYELKDAHTMNVLFRGGQAVYVDIGSFQKKQGPSWVGYNEFMSCFIVPLCFWAEGNFYMVRKLLESNFYKMQTIPSQDIFDSQLLELLPSGLLSYKFCIRRKIVFKTNGNFKLLKLKTRVLNKIVSLVLRRNSVPFAYFPSYKDIAYTRKKLLKLQYPQTDSLWKNYHTKYYNKEGQILVSDRFKRILEIVKNKCQKEQISSILDLAGNEGLFSYYLEENTSIPCITLADYDENALEKAICIQSERNSRINIVLLNFMFTPNIEGTSKRLKSDIVVALAVTHHLILTSQFLLSTIFERIRSFSNKYVFIEFMPLGLWGINDESYPEIPKWYTVEWFREQFENYFDLEIEEKLEDNRILFVGRLKENL